MRRRRPVGWTPNSRGEFRDRVELRNSPHQRPNASNGGDWKLGMLVDRLVASHVRTQSEVS
jgi:hypothetical protein